MQRPTLAVVTGPTASGKTELAIGLARHYNTEIVSADSRQIFRDIPIGTAAPTADEQRRAVHHLVGILPLDAYFSASEFERRALELLDEIWKKSPVAVVCGGSMMYIDALCNGLDDMPTVTAATRNYVLALLHEHGLEGVLAQLQILDPEYYAVVDRANTRRVVHAVEISLQSGRPYSSFRTGARTERSFNIVKFSIDYPREQLFARINARVESMVADGLVDEARRAFSLGSFNSLNTVGYKEIKAWLDGEMDYDTAIARIAKNTRVYAKKQMTWLKGDTSVHRLDPATALPQAIEIIDSYL